MLTGPDGKTIVNVGILNPGGGGIFIDGFPYESEKTEDANFARFDININNSVFDGCQAPDGSAIYLF